MTRPTHWGLADRHGNITVRRPILVLTILTAVLMLDATSLVRIGLLCALLHEGGHSVTYLLLLRRCPRLVVSITGITLCLNGILLTPLQQLLLALAGPAANFSLGGLALLWMWGIGKYAYGGYWFAAINILVGASNLLPVPGLDGAMALQAIAQLKLQSDTK